MTPDLEQRLAAVERGLDELQRRLESDREHAERARRLGVWVRLGVLAAVVLVYVLYMRSVASLT